MTVYVDHARTPRLWFGHNTFWSHLFADDIDELHAFAQQLKLKRIYLHISSSGIPHYDVTERKRTEAIRLGAKAVTNQEAVELWRTLYSGGSGKTNKDLTED